MIEALQFEFMRNALLAAVLVSIACGIVGTYVVVKRIVFITGGISHTAFGGIGLGYFLNLNPILVAIPFSLLSAIGIGLLCKRTRVSEDTAIGLVWTIGMALGILFVNLTPGYAPNLQSYLFGSILTVPMFDILLMLTLDVIVFLTVALFYKEFSALSFDEEFSNVVGVPTEKLYLLLLCLIALGVVVLIRIVGIILVIALLTLPSSISNRFTYNLKKLMALSILIGIILTITGLWISFTFNLSAGATIVLVMGITFLLSLVIQPSDKFS